MKNGRVLISVVFSYYIAFFEYSYYTFLASKQLRSETSLPTPLPIAYA